MTDVNTSPEGLPASQGLGTPVMGEQNPNPAMTTPEAMGGMAAAAPAPAEHRKGFLAGLGETLKKLISRKKAAEAAPVAPTPVLPGQPGMPEAHN